MGQALEVNAPPPDFGNTFGGYGLQFFNGSLYLGNGDGLFRLDESGSAPAFVSVASGFRTAFADPNQESQDGGFAISADGTVLVPAGFAGGATFANLGERPLIPIEAPDIDNAPGDPTTDNIFAVTGAGGGRFYVTGDVTRVGEPGRVYAFTPATGEARLVTTLPGLSSGGLAVAPNRLVVASTFDFINGRVSFFDVDPDTGTTTFVTTVDANGSGSVIVDTDGTVFFASNTGIAQLTPLGEAISLVGNIDDPDPFGSPAVTLNGLALDPSADRLFFLRQTGDGMFVLNDLLVPEPSAVTLLALGTLLITRRRRGAAR